MGNPQYPIIAKWYKIRVYQPGIGPRIISAFMADLQAQDLSGQNVTFSISGAPSGSTLPAGFTNYLAGDICFDAAGQNGYQCTGSGSSASSTWQQIGTGNGGGGAQLQQFKIVSDAGDYWQAKTWDGTTLGTITQSIIKPFKLRCGANKINSETIRGTTYTYTYASNGIFSRTNVGSDGSREVDYIIPDPLVNDVIYALPCSTPVFASSNIGYPIISATIANAGMGYASGDTLTCSAPTGSGGSVPGVACQLEVTINGSGAVTGVTISNGGFYFLAITNPASFTGGAGAGATFNLTLQSPLIDINADGRAWGAQ